ncbi:MAG: PilZ domain-containing protein [Magnetococcales bacterium]|nr:PilZ domain-containing protein [Magnetococcales bacterium]MBF0419331.1 PilZ domain-containing protein [Magnetococcales bacterium]
MAEHFADSAQPENLLFWYRRVSPAQLAVIRECRTKGVQMPEARPGMGEAVASLLAKEAGIVPSTAPRGQQGLARASVLEAMNRKFNLLLGLVYPPESVVQSAPVMLDPEGAGVVAWLKDPSFAENDCVELRFLASAKLPWPFHSYCRVARMVQENSRPGVRVEFRFETVHPNVPGTESPPARKLPPPKRDSVPAKPVVAPPKPVVAPPKPVAPPRVVSAPPIAKPVNPVTSVRTPKPDLPEPVKVVAEKDEDKYERMLQEGMKLSQAKIGEAVAKKGGDPFLASQPQVDKRRDFRINDRIPFIWSHVSEESFKEAMATFHKDKAFTLRSIIRNQQKILTDLANVQEVLKRKRSKARKHVDWHRDRLSWLFLRAASENEETYYQHMTELFMVIASDMAKQGGGAISQWSMQALSLLRNMMELKQTRDQSNPITEANAVKKAESGLADVERQLPKVLAKVEEGDPALAAKMTMYKEAIGAIDLTLHDRPVGKTADGKDLYTVNISATGLAFRTRRLWVKKGDLLEMRVFLSSDGKKFEPVNTYGRVVFVHGPVDNKLKVATFIDPKPALYEQKIYLHIARRQREMLSERASVRDDDF